MSNNYSVGVGIGSALAMIISFAVNKSIWWAILHAFCSWGYVIYRGIVGGY